jgi:hypothetical protein
MSAVGAFCSSFFGLSMSSGNSEAHRLYQHIMADKPDTLQNQREVVRPQTLKRHDGNYVCAGGYRPVLSSPLQPHASGCGA